jgi:Flp pilus assembly pilin Flp
MAAPLGLDEDPGIGATCRTRPLTAQGPGEVGRFCRMDPNAPKGGEQRMQEFFLKALVELQTRLMSVREEGGQAMVEYGILLALISVAALVFIPGVGSAVSKAFSTVSAKIS